MTNLSQVREVRPYQLACLFCRAGAEDLHPTQERVAELAAKLGETPDMPLAVRCNVGDTYAYQDPGHAEDTPEGPDFNCKRDVDLLRYLDLAPGSILPARTLLKRLLARVPSVRRICGYEDSTGPAWEGCAKAFSGDYERGHAMGIEVLIPARPTAEMQAEKTASMAAVEKADVVPIRPHILLCAVCQYAYGYRPPFDDDNLPELLQMILEPDCELQVKLVAGADWMMCAPCPSRSPAGLCIGGLMGSSGLYNEAKDLNILQALGLTYGTVIGAREIYRLIFERIPTVEGVCALTVPGVSEHSVWKDGCGAKTFPSAYEEGREALRARFSTGV